MTTAQLKINVTRVIDPFNFWAHIGTDANLTQFKDFEESVNVCCGTTDGRCLDSDALRPGQLILAKCSTLDRWRRAVVISIDSEAKEVDVLYVDYSSTEFVPLDSIVDDVPKHVQDLPRQAWKCTLAAVKPIAQTWISRAVNYFTRQVLDQKHDVQLLHVDDATVVVDILIGEGENQTPLSSLLVDEGFALPVTINKDKNSPKKGAPESAVPTFDLHSLATRTAPRKDRDDETTNDDGQPNFELELFAKGVDINAVPTYSGCNDHDLSIPQSPCDTIGNIHSQIDFMKENAEKLTPSRAGRNRPWRHHAKDLEKASLLKDKTGKMRDVEWTEGEKKFTYVYPPRHRQRMKGLVKDYGVLHSDRGSDNSTSSQSPPPQAHYPAPDPLKQASRHSPPPTKSTHRRESRNGRSPGNQLPFPDAFQRGSHKQGNRQQIRGVNFGDGDGMHRKSLPKSRSPVRPIAARGVETVVTASSREQLQKEYDWHSSQFTFKVAKMLEDVTEDNCTTKSRELHKVLSAVSSQLQELPGDGALYLSLETITQMAITEKMLCEVAVKLVESLSGLDEFPDILRKILLKFHGSVIKVTTTAKTKMQRRNFVFFVAMLFNRASRWEDSDAVTDCIISSLNMWAGFNTKATPLDWQGTGDLFCECLCVFINISGATLEECYPSDHKKLFKGITEKILSNDVARSVKEKMLQLLVNQPQTTSVLRGHTNGVTMATVPVAVATKASQTEEVAQMMTTESPIQVELLPCEGLSLDQLAPRKNSRCSEVDSIKSCDLDPYAQVKVMLSDLCLDELIDVFLSNAVRDSVLDVDFPDLKDLLRECGVRPGELLEIKTYLAKKAKCWVCDDIPSSKAMLRNNNVDTWSSNVSGRSSVTSTPQPQASAVLISPDVFSATSHSVTAGLNLPFTPPVIPDVHRVVSAATLDQPQKRCSIPPGFDVAVAAASKYGDDMAFSEDDSEESFNDADDARWQGVPRLAQIPASGDVTSTAVDMSCPSRDVVGSPQGRIAAAAPTDVAQDDPEVPSSWFDRKDTSVAPDLSASTNKSGTTHTRKFSPSSIKNIVDSWLKPNSDPVQHTHLQSNSANQHDGVSLGDVSGHVIIPTNRTPDASTVENASPDPCDWPSVTEAQIRPIGKGKGAAVDSFGARSRRKKQLTFPLEEHREVAPVVAVKHSFGSCQKRVCTLCGSEDHLIYDCPRGTRSLFFN